MMKPFILCYLIVLPFLVFGQQCFNAGLESGNVDGYATYIGSINNDGTVVIETSETSPDRHRIMQLNEGFDPIALANCTVFDSIPVVPEGGGQYALRLGNEDTGAEAERVLLNFTVTPDLTFFLLRYAVILNDPNHDDFEQPRFELRILDEDGGVFPCGEYKVRAAASIPGFESCSDGWRVLPWTTVGFELQSFLGQNIQIEILTTDCAQGGHAGYAYLDASCQPLEMKLEGYCPDATFVNLSVTNGFTDYLWNTGETTSSIRVDDPIPGTQYSVTVTSATGCTLVLEDTLPEIEELPTPQFDQLPDLAICQDQPIWIKPTGTNLNSIFCPELGYAADSFLLSPIVTMTYNFITSDLYGCKADTMSFTMEVRPPSLIASIDSVTCAGESNGQITVEVISDFPPFSYQWFDGTISSNLSNLSAGTYSITVTDSLGCTIADVFTVAEPAMLNFDQIQVDSASCFGFSDGAITIIPEGGSPTYSFFLEDSLLLENNIRDLAVGNYLVGIADEKGCTIQETVFVPEPPQLVSTISALDVSCFGYTDGQAQVDIMGGTPTYLVLWDDLLGQQTISAINLAPGSYNVTITDNNNCEITNQVTVNEPPPLQASLSIDSVLCAGGNDGSALVNVSGGTPNYSYNWNDVLSQSSAEATDLPAGNYTVTINDANNCSLIVQGIVYEPPVIQLSLQQDSVSCFGEEDGQAIAIATGGTPGYTFSWATIPVQNQAVAQGLATGNYSILVTDINGCTIGDSIYVLEPSLITVQPLIQLFPNCDQDIPGMTVIEAMGGNSYYFYEWETGSTSDTVASHIPGNYAVTVTDQKGCMATEIIPIIGLELAIDLAGLSVDVEQQESYLCLGDSVWLNVTANNDLRNIQWIVPTELNCNDCFTTSAFPTETIPYSVEVIDVDGCPAVARGNIIVNQRCGTYIPNIFSPNQDGNNDFFYVIESRGGERIGKFEIYNRWGEMVYQNPDGCDLIGDSNCGWDGTFRGQNLNPGVYVYYIEIYFFGMDKPIPFKGDILLIR